MAQRVHSEIYPSPSNLRNNKHGNLKYETLSVAAAFEGLHHWEHDQRLKGERVECEAARPSLADVAEREADRLLNAVIPIGDVDPDARQRCTSLAAQEAIYLFDKHYGMEEEWYDPKQMNPHEPMAEQWQGWGSDEERASAYAGADE